VREAWLFQQTNNPSKVFVVERLRRHAIEGSTTFSHAVGEVEYRLGYYIVGQVGRTKGRWIWGQFCPMIPAADLLPLIERARKEGVILG
jgi:hypothetical protein